MTELNSSAPTPDRSKLTGRLVIVAAALMWSTSGFFAKAPIFDDWDPQSRGTVLAFWRAVFASLVLLPMVRRPRLSWKLVPFVLIFAAMNYTYLNSMARAEASIAIWLQNTAPLWVFLVGVFYFRESVSPRDWLMLAIGMLGVSLILFNELQGASSAGVIYGLFGGLTYAAVVLSLRQLRDFESAWLIALAHLGTAAILSPWAIGFGRLPSGSQWFYLAAFGMLQMGIPYVLFARGLRSVAGHEASGIVLLEPVLVPLWVFLAWHNHDSYEPPQWWTLTGGGLILAGLLMRYYHLARRRSSLEGEEPNP